MATTILDKVKNELMPVSMLAEEMEKLRRKVNDVAQTQFILKAQIEELKTRKKA